MAVPNNPFTGNSSASNNTVTLDGTTQTQVDPATNPVNIDIVVTSTASNELKTKSNQPKASVGTQSIWPPSGGEDSDGSGGFGYATVRSTSPVTGTGSPSPVANTVPGAAGMRSSVGKDSPIAGLEPTVAGIGSSASPDRNQVSPKSGRPLPEPPGPASSRVSPARGLEPDSDIDSPVAAAGTTHTIIRDITFSPGGAVALYTKVNKSAPKSSPKKTNTSLPLPPKKAPSGLTRKGHHSESPRTREYLVTPPPTGMSGIAGVKVEPNDAHHSVAAGAKHPGYLSWDGVEYTDEEYIPSGDDTFSITDTNSEEELVLQNLQSHTPTQNSRPAQGDKPHHTHHMYRSSTPNQPRNIAGESPRPNSTPPNLENVPFIKPSFIQQVTPVHSKSQTGANGVGEVYVFSEKQPDGTVHYYTATPVEKPSMTKHSPLRPPSTPPLIQQPTTPTEMLTLHARAQLGSRNVLESGYCSNPTTTVSPMSPRHHQQSTSCPDDTRTSVAGIIRGTRITKIGSSTHDPLCEASPAAEVAVQRDRVDQRSDYLREKIHRKSGQDEVDAGTKDFKHQNIPPERTRLEQTGAGIMAMDDRAFKHRSERTGIVGAGMDWHQKIRSERAGAGDFERGGSLSKADTGVVATIAGISQESDHNIDLREKIRSLMAENATLEQQLVRELNHRKITEV